MLANIALTLIIIAYSGRIWEEHFARADSIMYSQSLREQTEYTDFKDHTQHILCVSAARYSKSVAVTLRECKNF